MDGAALLFVELLHTLLLFIVLLYTLLFIVLLYTLLFIVLLYTLLFIVLLHTPLIVELFHTPLIVELFHTPLIVNLLRTIQLGPFTNYGEFKARSLRTTMSPFSKPLSRIDRESDNTVLGSFARTRTYCDLSSSVRVLKRLLIKYLYTSLVFVDHLQ